jgi:hypothetical protein
VQPQSGPPLQKKHGLLRVETQCIASLQSPTRSTITKKTRSIRSHRNGGYGFDGGDTIDGVSVEFILN